MKNLIYSIMVTAIFVGCGSVSSQKSNSAEASGQVNDTLRIANDSLEYEVIIIEPGFFSWLATQPPRGFYSQSTMEIVNSRKVLIYNLRSRNPIQFDPNLYPFPIDYERDIDYGYEVNYMLYNYFLFFEQRYNQRLL
ncbi:DUF6146 family protein [Nonlabens xiamenensis]|uniref:DUF6146 family protein n=1 Tax=Nonlabens xiamenensis TaxID=2341043 RepID=UPI000F608BA3|nr:DUF6146 family protein [Nonlabens xiamenensis]